MAKAKRERIAFIGGGNMATALVRGLLAAGRRPTALVVAEPDSKRRATMRRRFHVDTTASNGEAASGADVVLLAVKPQVMESVLEGLKEGISSSQLVISIAAGVRLSRIEGILDDGVRAVRAMPNTPCLVARGVTVLCGGSRVRRADLSTARDIFRAVGEAHIVDDERLMDAVTALSGSGPAYVYRFAEAMIDAGVRCGLSRPLSSALTYQTIAGAAEMLLRTGETPETLRTAVSSPGGTTLAGLAAMDAAGFFEAVMSAVDSAMRRSRELAGDVEARR